ncbi:GAP family protein [Krasilnikoviella flava]|uniref:Sap, sulfolipid-1-addressing protein n=1 Tax=Krasilnikoviella flava TaxID=526729 RepID=A0A1T5LK33_9MICO|nr:GAP family protein [Krasilnikoviella flava]SKC76351.1 Sap, sulfolipid-1-addressing protein [Krasilnikoviella flava]
MDLPLDLGGLEGAGLGAMAGVLVVLALIDSTSFGTLLIPVWLLMAPGRPRAGRMFAYLGTVAVFYLAVGVAVLLGAGAFLDRFGDALDSRPALIVQLLLGLGLFALSFRFDGKRARARAAREGARPGRLVRWRERAMGIETAGAVIPADATPGLLPASTTATAVRQRSSLLPLMGLALGAVALEVGTMLPYLAAIGLITTSDLGTGTGVGVLAVYCVVMVLPALLLLGGRLVAARAVDPLLVRLERWLSKNAAEMTGWVLGILGVLLALNAMGSLGWTG